MVGDLLKLVDRLLQLLGERKRTREQLFREAVEPLFVALGPVVDEQIALFRFARQAVVSDQPANIEWVSQEVARRREETQLLRERVRQMAAAVRDTTKDERTSAFADKVASFFYRTQLERTGVVGLGLKSVTRELADVLADYVQGRLRREHVSQYIWETEDLLAQSWADIAYSYAHLRMHCLIPSALRRDMPIKADVES